MPFGSSIPGGLSYATALSVLNQGERDKLLCAYLNSTDAVTFDADKALADFGSTGSAQSFKNGVGGAQNKIKKAMGAVETADGDDAGPSTTPATKAKAKPGRKRKTDTTEENGDAAPKKKGRSTKKVKAEEKAVEEEGGDEVEDDA